FGMKFSLISVLFFLPMLVTSFYLVRDAYRQFYVTGVELSGLGPVTGSLALRGDLESLGNLLQINAVLGQSGQAGDVEARIDALEDKVQAQLQALASQDPQLEAKRVELADAFAKARAE